MKHLWRTFIAVGLLLAIIEGPDLGETKSIKKKLKELKKLKKYAYLLAGQRKKLYAIPFPMPLPVFVKRQHIYTQVPIIPRYVHYPQPYATPSVSMGDAYATSSSNVPEIHNYLSEMPVLYSQPKGYSTNHGTKKRHLSASPSSSSSSSSNNQDQQQQQQHQQQQLLGSYGKYLSQIATLLDQTSSMLGVSGVGGGGKDIFSKLLNGQARVLPPSALISALKTPSSAALTSNNQKSKNHDQQDQNSQQQDNQQDQDYKSATKNSNSNSGSGSQVNYDDTPNNSSRGAGSDSNNSDIKASPSEMYRTALGYRQHAMRNVAAYNPYANLYRLNAQMMAPLMSPLAALAMASRTPGHLLRVGPLAVGNVLPQIDPSMAGSNQIDSQEDPQEASASSQQEQEGPGAAVPTRADYLRAQYNLLKQGQLQQHLRSQQQQHQQLQGQPDPILVSAVAQRMYRQQEALKMALLREQEVAARLAESRQILVRAHQLGLPMVPGGDQANLLKYYRQQSQVVVS